MLYHFNENFRVGLLEKITRVLKKLENNHMEIFEKKG